MAILNYISHSLGEGNRFKIGDLDITKEYSVIDLEIKSVDKVDKKIPFIYSPSDDLIYVDRRYLDIKALTNKSLDKFILTDYKFLFKNLENITKAFDRLKFKNKKIEHRNIRKIICNLFGQ